MCMSTGRFWTGWKWLKDADNGGHFVDLCCSQKQTVERCKEGRKHKKRKEERSPHLPPFLLLLSLLPPVAIYPSLNGVCLPDLPRMKCHISDWSLSLNRFLCLPWFPRPSLTSLLGHWPLMCQPQLGTMGVGHLWSVYVYVCMCVCVLKWRSGSALS